MGGRIITNWESIAQFFGKSASTVKRWSQVYPDFPVRKEFAARKGRVWSTRTDLLAWANRHGVSYVSSAGSTDR